jgi:hypothetical protein
MEAAAIVLVVLVGLALWLTGAATLYSLLELVDVLRPDKPDEKPVAVWTVWLGLALVLFPLVMLLGIARVVMALLGRVGAPMGARAGSPRGRR